MTIYKVSREENGRVYSKHRTLIAARKVQNRLFKEGKFGYKIFKEKEIVMDQPSTSRNPFRTKIWIRV